MGTRVRSWAAGLNPPHPRCSAPVSAPETAKPGLWEPQVKNIAWMLAPEQVLGWKTHVSAEEAGKGHTQNRPENAQGGRALGPAVLKHLSACGQCHPFHAKEACGLDISHLDTRIWWSDGLFPIFLASSWQWESRREEGEPRCWRPS